MAPPKRSNSAGTTSGKTLVIVESPAKARTIGRFLGADFVVESSVGHIRDLPRGAAEVPAAYKNEEWAKRFGVDVDNGFKPLYVVAREKKDVVSRLKTLLKDASELFLATDEDREGESIAWHLTEVLNPTVPVKRMVFHEITQQAIERAVEEWRELDRHLVDAQEARRILDRLYGYEVSPVLWRKVMPGLSAGRVQSVATRMIVERERARMAFRAATWWDVEGTFDAAGRGFGATLVAVDGTTVATGRDFDSGGALTARAEVVVLGEPEAQRLVEGLAGRPFTVKGVTEKPFRRSPAPPFMTSTLQQEASRKLRFGAQRAMQVAQRLYEQGWITYMRTDSTTLSDEALAAARGQAAQLYGSEFVPDAPRRYERKVKNAQEAHEAIRPSGEVFRTPDEAARSLSGDELRLYDLIWKRTVASQMADATGTSAQLRLVGSTEAGPAGPAQEAEFSASGTVITFPGFLRAYVEGSDDPDAELAEREVVLPPLAQGDRVDARELEAKSHSTQPPARYTEASLVKALEELGVGRPSTYASILGTIQNRGYVWHKGSALVPSFTAFAVVGLLERYFAELVDYGFTASMEDDLDEIASGQRESLPWLTAFYFGQAEGNGHAPGPGLKEIVAAHLDEIDAREINSIPIGEDAEGNPIVVRVGRYGPYLQRGEERASIPEDLPPDELTIERADELLLAPSGDRELGTDPASGLIVYAKSGRFGPYVQLGELVEGADKPRTASLFKTMSLEALTLEDALELLTLPRPVGNDPESGEEILALNGRFGPYLKKGTDTRSLETEEQLLTVTLEHALALFAQPKTRRGRGAAAAPLRELGPDPDSGAPIVLRAGRFGPYVTDGTTNASLRTGDDPDTITPERAQELLANRRAAGPSPRRAKKAAAAKKTAKKATAAKKTAKKTAAKKAPAKKAAGAKQAAGAKKAAGAKQAVAKADADATEQAVATPDGADS
ncbi:MAG TPA: type I DNA topoisomerase [Acidimicrobiales bacterium]|nr:type I DNA topoisomerase [Acidimicrobiales bacterium]